MAPLDHGRVRRIAEVRARSHETRAYISHPPLRVLRLGLLPRADARRAFTVLGRIASLTVSFDNVSTPLAIVMAIAAVGHYVPKKWFNRMEELFSAAPFYAKAAALVQLVIEYTAATGAAPFIYTKF